MMFTLRVTQQTGLNCKEHEKTEDHKNNSITRCLKIMSETRNNLVGPRRKRENSFAVNYLPKLKFLLCNCDGLVIPEDRKKVKFNNWLNLDDSIPEKKESEMNKSRNGLPGTPDSNQASLRISKSGEVSNVGFVSLFLSHALNRLICSKSNSFSLAKFSSSDFSHLSSRKLSMTFSHKENPQQHCAAAALRKNCVTLTHCGTILSRFCASLVIKAMTDMFCKQDVHSTTDLHQDSIQSAYSRNTLRESTGILTHPLAAPDSESPMKSDSTDDRCDVGPMPGDSAASKNFPLRQNSAVMEKELLGLSAAEGGGGWCQSDCTGQLLLSSQRTGRVEFQSLVQLHHHKSSEKDSLSTDSLFELKLKSFPQRYHVTDVDMKSSAAQEIEETDERYKDITVADDDDSDDEEEEEEELCDDEVDGNLVTTSDEDAAVKETHEKYLNGNLSLALNEDDEDKPGSPVSDDDEDDDGGDDDGGGGDGDDDEVGLGVVKYHKASSASDECSGNLVPSEINVVTSTGVNAVCCKSSFFISPSEVESSSDDDDDDDDGWSTCDEEHLATVHDDDDLHKSFSFNGLYLLHQSSVEAERSFIKRPDVVSLDLSEGDDDVVFGDDLESWSTFESENKDNVPGTLSLQLQSVNTRWRQFYSIPSLQETKGQANHPENRKKVRFARGSSLVTTHRENSDDAEDYATARKGPWEEYARDRDRFRRRIQETGEKISWIFSTSHRNKLHPS